MPTFTTWLIDRFAERGVTNFAEIARALGVATSTISRPPKTPSATIMRSAATALGLPMREVLVAAGYLTEDEATPPLEAALREIPSRHILDELGRRLGTPSVVRPALQQTSPQDLPMAARSSKRPMLRDRIEAEEGH